MRNQHFAGFFGAFDTLVHANGFSLVSSPDETWRLSLSIMNANPASMLELQGNDPIR
jgi:hypothetical protein